MGLQGIFDHSQKKNRKVRRKVGINFTQHRLNFTEKCPNVEIELSQLFPATSLKTPKIVQQFMKINGVKK